MHGTRTANYAMDDADLIVAVGARFDDRITGKLVRVRAAGQVRPHRRRPGRDLEERPRPHPDRRRRRRRAAEADPRVPGAEAGPDAARRVVEADPRAGRPSTRSRYEDSADSEIKPQLMIEAMYEATEGEAIITSDVGQHQMWAAQYYHFAEPRRWINSGGLGTMGFGLPAAIGAKVARPDETVVCLAGDGSLVMVCQEFATAALHEIPVKVFLMNNGYLGMVRQWQELFWDGALQVGRDGREPRLGEARRGVRLDRDAVRPTRRDCASAMQTALETDGPVLLDVHVTKDENCYPMIPAGRRGAGHGGMRRPWKPGRQTWSSSRTSRSSRRSPGASTSSRCWSRTSPASWRGSRACSAAAGSTSTRSRSARPRTPTSRGSR